MHIIYAVTTCSDAVYKQLFSHVKVRPAFQSQKYHRLLIEGLAANAEVDVVANPPVNRSTMDKPWIRLSRETEGGAHYHNISAIRNPFLKLIVTAFGTFLKTAFLTRKDSVVVVDVLNRTVALFALLAAKLQGCRCVGIVTDLPDMLPGSSFSKKLANYVTRHCTDYVLLTEAMNEYIQNPGKPYVVLEGQADITMNEYCPDISRKAQPRICMYAGCVSKEYGLGDLVEGFCMTGFPDVELHIYGPCGYQEELKHISTVDPRVYYGGMLMNSEIVEKEMEATLLINARPTHEEFVKYSFPSKNMEYMASGTPVLTTKLPGMPKEYNPHVFLIEEETAEGIAKALEHVFTHSDEELFQKGMNAREFVLTQKNNVVQAKKIIEMLNQ